MKIFSMEEMDRVKVLEQPTSVPWKNGDASQTSKANINSYPLIQ